MAGEAYFKGLVDAMGLRLWEILEHSPGVFQESLQSQEPDNVRVTRHPEWYLRGRV